MAWFDEVVGPVTKSVPALVEGEMIGGDAGFERGVDEDFAAGTVGCATDFEDGAGAVADEEVAVAVEGDAGGDAHAFGVGGDGALGRDAVDGAFGAGAGVEVAVAVEGEAGGVEQIADEGADLEVALDLKDGDGDGLAARLRRRWRRRCRRRRLRGWRRGGGFRPWGRRREG
jgi:hypothetical protein